MAQDMMKRIREMLAAGKTEEQVVDYFVQRYGEWALLKPKAKGFNLLVWILPPIGLIAGVLGVASMLQRMAAKREEETDDAPVSIPEEDSDDPYLSAVRDEVGR